MFNQKYLHGMGVLACIFALVAPATAQEEGAVIWFTEAEAEALRLTEEDIGFLSAQSKSLPRGGPEIHWVFPELSGDAGLTKDKRVTFTSPSSLTIEFRKTNGAIDFETLDVRGRKFGFSKSVTDLVRPYLDGNVLAAKNVELPKGKFLVEVEIHDVEGRKTVRPFFVNSK
jgi:hypothetical protein